MNVAEPSGPQELMGRVEAEMKRLAREGIWTESQDHALDEAFEDAAQAALRMPAIFERSTRMRRLARRFVPLMFRPLLRALVTRTEAMLRRFARSRARARQRDAL
jgi:hypothetical protein